MVASIILISALKLFNKPVEKVQWAGDHDRAFGGLTIILRDNGYQAKANCIIFCFSSNPFSPQFFQVFNKAFLKSKFLTGRGGKVKFFMDPILCF